ncbi:MAG TPA: MotA/TolQ/ExbB proton channel family protein [Gemmataceae bacterium]|nr:MotA/TolQ/ExbB proton channel family protein [Gemmataceae bacterium]
MRRALIQTVLPVLFCAVPLLVAVLILVALPGQAVEDYLHRVRTSYIDWIILGLGLVLFAVQMLLAWRAMQWRGTGFDEGADRWLSTLAQAAEWFPMLGLLGTVAGILQTFGSIASTGGPVAPERIIALYAPAITATGSGLFMALLNILPTWVVLIGRQLILSLSGGEAAPEADAEPYHPERVPADRR